MTTSQWQDLTVPLRHGMMHWPGDPPVTVTPVKTIAGGDSANLSSITMGAHSGTHVDAPRHFLENGIGIDEIPADVMVGPARVIEIQSKDSIQPDELIPHDIRPGDRILFKTRNSAISWYAEPFREDFVFISDDAAGFLADRGGD